MSTLSAQPQVTAFLACHQLMPDQNTKEFSAGRGFYLYPVRQIPCTGRGFYWLLEMHGGRGTGVLEIHLAMPVGDETIPVFKREVTFKGPGILQTWTGRVPNFEVKEPGRYRLELLADGVPLVIRPLLVFAPPRGPGAPVG